MRVPASLAAVALLHAFAGHSHADGPKGAVHQFTLPKPAAMVGAPMFYAWIPEGAGPFRSIIVHQHGCTREGDAQQMMGDVQWKSFAKKWHSPFVAPRFVTGEPGTGSSQCSNWYNPANGSGEAFIAFLDSLARKTGHPEIKAVPWALWGHSGGSMWSTAMAGKHPERVASVVAQSCGSEISDVGAALKIPILHHNGKSDICHNDGYFAKGRAKGALWAHAINPSVTWATGALTSLDMMGHAPCDLRMIAIPWLDAALTGRLGDPGQAALRDMDAGQAWLGDTATHAIAASAAFAGDKLQACWFPNRYFAQRWKEYMETGRIKDSLPPPAPYNLAGAYANRQIKLAWDGDADPETGIKAFVIHRNGKAFDTLDFPNAPETRFTREKGYQRWNDGDQPSPSNPPAMAFTDANLNDTATYLYQISCVNWAGAEGPKSATLTLARGQVTCLGGTIRGRQSGLLNRVFWGWGMRNRMQDDPDAAVEAYDARGMSISAPAVSPP